MRRRPFLDRMDADTRARLDRAMTVRRYGRDEVVIDHHEESADVFFVIEGTARATIFSEEGTAIAFRDISAGEIFGELAAIDNESRSASVIATGPMRIGRMPTSRFREFVDTYPPFTWALLQHLSHQARQMTQRIFEYSTMLARDRLLQELIRLAEAAGAETGRAEIAPAPTHAELAARISTQREAVSREMSKLAKAELIVKSGGRLVIRDLDRLRALRERGR